MSGVIEIRHYVSRAGKGVFDDWLSQLADARAQAKIAARIDRLVLGNFGDCEPLGGGLWELRISWGPGYRLYYALIGRACVLLLCGGDKKSSRLTSTAHYVFSPTTKKGPESNET